MDEGNYISRHGLRLLATFESWSNTNELEEALVPAASGCVLATGTSAIGIPSKSRVSDL